MQVCKKIEGNQHLDDHDDHHLANKLFGAKKTDTTSKSTISQQDIVTNNQEDEINNNKQTSDLTCENTTRQQTLESKLIYLGKDDSR